MDQARFPRERVGDLSQLFQVKEYRLLGGRADGVRACDVRNGSGLEFTVLPDRAMDLAWLSFRGVNLAFVSRTGVVSPLAYEPAGLGWLRSFTAGFLTTCGLENVGSPCSEGGEAYGQHGRIGNAPAEQVGVQVTWDQGAPVATLRGRMRQGRPFGEGLALERTLETRWGEPRLRLHDVVKNEGFRTEPFELLYHVNLGHPLLDEGAEVVMPSRRIEPRTPVAAAGLADWARVDAPRRGFEEQVFYHALGADPGGATFAALLNRALGLGVVLRHDARELPILTQWRMLGEGEYVMGLEPGNCHVDGRVRERERGTLPTLEPGEERSFSLTIEVLEGQAALDGVVAERDRLR